MRESDWKLLLTRADDGLCTPFLGAGAVAHALPLGADIAARWAKAHGYPLEDGHDLARVAQFVAVHQDDAMYPKELLGDELRTLALPDFTAPGEPHMILARMPLPVFITTNYDDSMYQALVAAGKDPRREVCRWNRSPALAAEPSPLQIRFTPRHPRIRSSSTFTAAWAFPNRWYSLRTTTSTSSLPSRVTRRSSRTRSIARWQGPRCYSLATA